MAEERTKKAELKISGMTGAACATTIEKSLASLEDVINAQVNLGNETAVVEYVPTKLKLADLEKSVTDAGYEVINEKVTLKIDNPKITTTSDMKKAIPEYKHAEEKFRQQNEFLNSVLESLAYPFYVIDVHDYTIKIANSAARQKGLSEGAVCYAFTHGRSSPCNTMDNPCPIEEIKKTKRPVTVEHIHYDKDGNPRNVEVHGYPIFDSEGNVVQIIENCFDITERKRAEEELRRHRDRLEELVQERTEELTKTIKQLQKEIAERKQVEEELRSSRQQLRDLFTHLQTIREKERTRIAREIHDTLGQILTALKMELSWLNKRFDTEQQKPLFERIESMSELIDSAIQTVKKISTKLRPEILDDLGLAAAIEWQAKEFEERTEIKCKVHTFPEDIVLDGERSTAIFRIFQETLTNVARHAHATKVKVNLEEKDNKLVLEVKDNGKGITEKAISDSKSLGLIGISERVSSLKGEVRINGVKNKGTTVKVNIPLES